ncbi:hypothetical protein PP940_gp167 [Rhizobium phage RL2RES]|uniref:Uncharacterized protein n=1 Tax=Rhizobium phage RL2RES TaxID=103371 RepID=A0A6B9J243_9CAUD|nr:hypothetical protein PP940_gp167 [Rhizobium phage RL2RES]QGZ14320.1 hypothetical protein RL2RES_167 [Rhizobium phage RL2RES]
MLIDMREHHLVHKLYTRNCVQGQISYQRLAEMLRDTGELGSNEELVGLEIQPHQIVYHVKQKELQCKKPQPV